MMIKMVVHQNGPLVRRELAGIKPAQHYRWLAASAAYWEAFTELQEDVTRRLQDRVVELAMEGWTQFLHLPSRLRQTVKTQFAVR